MTFDNWLSTQIGQHEHAMWQRAGSKKDDPRIMLAHAAWLASSEFTLAELRRQCLVYSELIPERAIEAAQEQV
jgi:hypothetical protein